MRLRGALKRNGRLPRHILSGLLMCEQCGGTFRMVNAREYGCASHTDGGAAACTNGVRVAWELAEKRLLDKLEAEILSPAGIGLVEKRVRERLRAQATASKPAPKQEPQIAKKRAEIERLRSLMRTGTLSQAVAQAAIEKADEELRSLERARPVREEKQAARIIRLLPRAADVLRERVGGGNLGLRDPRSIVQARNVLFSAFGRVPMRPAAVKPGEQPYLIARIALNREVLLELDDNVVSLRNTQDERVVFAGPDGGPIDYSNWRNRVWLPLLKKTGPDEKHTQRIAVDGTFHMLRHSYATALIQSGENAKTVATLVGHHSVAFTMDVYADAWPQAISETADKVTDVLFGGSGSNLVASEKSADSEGAEVIDLIGGPCANRTRDQLVKRIPLKFSERCDFVGLQPLSLSNIFPT